MNTLTGLAFRPLPLKFIAASIIFAILGTLVFMAAGSFISGEATFSFGYAPTALAIHLGTVIPALFLGAAILVMKKGTALHKILGRVWAVLMMTTAISSFWLQGMTGGIGPIHIFSVITLVSIPRAIWAIRKGDVEAHRQAMTGPYIGLVVAGLFSFLPGRMMGDLAFALLG